MNSLNIITSRVSSPTQSRFGSDDAQEPLPGHDPTGPEKINDVRPDGKKNGWWLALPRRLVSSLIRSIRLMLVALASPAVYLLYDHDGRFAPLSRLGKLFLGPSVAITLRRPPSGPEHMREKPHTSSSSSSSSSSTSLSLSSPSPLPPLTSTRLTLPTPPLPDSSSSGSSTSGASSGSETEDPKWARHSTTTKSSVAGAGRRSIRIKLQPEEEARKHRRTRSAVERAKASERDISAQLKSPTSPIAALTRYPKTPAPPRPLIPRRQPSYLNLDPAPLAQQKTLILDLDETLIHSMSKGGRMSTGHMVEVRLNTASVRMGAGRAAQHPILYWVNKRPFCDEFLRRVCKWFNLVVFTASVQEYADPVIDWLESERKFFSARYYRQHCTYRQGAYIKDLSSVEPDLSKVMILDNSPLSYLFHQDNAIPIQGWINDPTDNDLMHLVPMLEGLQYVHDVRALLALRGGEDGQHMA
ncbi:hypothetical protein L249_1985 [Ophiocordyceps polyrhachis-furcata BCC 54312]|uniref:FCP1 homology domain-containing protein n=1 Tax=Ophiocordyceps polyrhachis-furcata BCC 54312 TaxID=1330021 RepID=A0A367LPU1_9HYPO|nr:hypothetical protein L249_1985 [Ophiocordyceps polyrhachis-furcata BCC 54312]